MEELRPEFDKRGVKVVTVSVDLPEVIAEKRHLHGIQATMLSDQALVVTDAFGLRNQGVHSAPASEPAKALPVPATLLVDRDGTVYGAICLRTISAALTLQLFWPLWKRTSIACLKRYGELPRGFFWQHERA